jgi:Protein of unknown function (DUF3775)
MGRGTGKGDRRKAGQVAGRSLQRGHIGATMRAERGNAMIEIASDKVVQVIFLSREGNTGDTELAAFIGSLNDEKAHLTAIAWVGRGAFDAADYDTAVDTALAEATVPTENYLMGMPHLAENLEAGLDAMGVDVAGAEEDFL